MKVFCRQNLVTLATSLIALTLTSCVSVNASKQNFVLFDFGLSASDESHQPVMSKIMLEKPIAPEALNHHKIRYRLNYNNPSRVYFYTKSRWAATPQELLLSKASQIISYDTTISNNCSLQLKIEAFDHVFSTVESSYGVIQLNALVKDKRTYQIIVSQLFSESVASSTPDAQGGTTALEQASEVALRKMIKWSNEVLDNNQQCN
jgi:cholesterol transport system auxiliary component